MVGAARAQRREPTPTERKLWAALRGRGLADLKFRRQHAYGGFVLDAFCVEHQLEVEVDGGIHQDPKQAAYDAERTKFLEARGVRVLRFKVEEIEKTLPSVLQRIIAATQPTE
jgi:very-short-patch-repair endonuclease